MSGYRALRESAAWLDISLRGRISVAGEDRVQFVHAMCSNDVQSLEPGQGVRAFFLDVQGHIQADTRIFVSEDHVLIDCEPERAANLQEHLERFIVMEDVALEHHSNPAVAIEGPDAELIARQVFDVAAPPAEDYSHAREHGLAIIRASLAGQPGLWLIAEQGSAEHGFENAGSNDTGNNDAGNNDAGNNDAENNDRASNSDPAAKLRAAGVAAATAADLLTVRVENGLPRQGDDFPDSTLPNHLEQAEAISFTKGCYLGQEIVERVRSRGQINRLLVPVELETTEPPDPGAVVLFKEKDVGRLTSPVFSPTMERVVAFAILRREAASPGSEFVVNGRRGRVRSPHTDKEWPERPVLVGSQ